MEILKKNLQFVIFCAACLLVCAGLVFLERQAAAKAKTMRNDAEKKRAFFENIRKGEFALTEENVAIAENNRQLMEKQLKEFEGRLHADYRIAVQENVTPVACSERLRKQILAFREELRAGDVILRDSEKNFVFQSIAESARVPPSELVPGILKQLRIVEEIVRSVRENHMKRLDQITLLDAGESWQGVEDEEELHTYNRYRLIVAGKTPDVQQLINNLQGRCKYLVAVRQVEFIREGETVQRADAPTRTPADARVPGEWVPPSMAGLGRDAETDEYSGPKRDERVATNGIVRVALVFDVLEFPEVETEG